VEFIVSLKRKIRQRTKRRANRVRSLLLLSDRPRVSVFRSLKNISAQIIDDQQHKTLIGFSSAQLETRTGDKTEVAFAVGRELARQALEKGVSIVVFDRGSYLYHGRVKALADGLREGGLQF